MNDVSLDPQPSQGMVIGSFSAMHTASVGGVNTWKVHDEGFGTSFLCVKNGVLLQLHHGAYNNLQTTSSDRMLLKSYNNWKACSLSFFLLESCY